MAWWLRKGYKIITGVSALNLILASHPSVFLAGGVRAGFVKWSPDLSLALLGS